MQSPIVSVPVKLTAKCPFCDEIAVVEVAQGKPVVAEHCHHAIDRPELNGRKLYVRFADDGEI